MFTLISFASQWGSKYGGINSFNTDFLIAFAAAYYQQVQIVCIVTSATANEIDEAQKRGVTLIPLPYAPQTSVLSEQHAESALKQLQEKNIPLAPKNSIFLGHDRITGGAALAAAKQTGARSALIHHMSYELYESFAENSQTASNKHREQKQLFKQADIVLAVGPLLRDAAQDMFVQNKNVAMLIPGLAEVEPRTNPTNTFTVFLSGRLSEDANKIKQGLLGVAAFASAYKQLSTTPHFEAKLTLRGVDFESQIKNAPNSTPETELKLFAENYAGGAINLQALPYTQDRAELYGELRFASVALMPSWHEGFGLTGWEAIAAGVPLIVSQKSGVYRFLDEQLHGIGTGGVYPVNIKGSNTEPYFHDDDLNAVTQALIRIAQDPQKARQQANTLRNLLINDYTWSACAAQATQAFNWPLHKGSISNDIPPTSSPTPTISPTSQLIVAIPPKPWNPSAADSQLLRAEEALVPFDPARQPELDKLNTWLNDHKHPYAIRLITGAGGTGKTRLALEFCQQTQNLGWHSGFLASDAKLDQGWLALAALNKPLLIVIDYAETRQAQLLTLIKQILNSKIANKVRVLLLARDAGEWWDKLPSKDAQCEALLSGYATTGPFSLSPLHSEPTTRQAAYQKAVQAFAQAKQLSTRATTPDLSAEHFERPLYLQMAALLALHGEQANTKQGLTRALLNHERRYWAALFSNTDFPDPAHHAEQLLALSTLTGGFASAKIAQTYWEQIYGKDLSSAQFKQLFNALIPLYPCTQGLETVRPDLLGEALVAQALVHPSATDVLDVILGAKNEQKTHLHALTVLARLSDNYPSLHPKIIQALNNSLVHCCQAFVIAARETPSKLPELAETAFNQLPTSQKGQIAGLLKTVINEESIQLAKFYCVIHRFLVDKAEEKLKKKPKEVGLLDDYAGCLNNYANSLKRFGQDEAALNHAKQALEIYQKLAEKNPDRFEPDVAMSLNNYANRLSDQGDHTAALSHAKQALDIRQKLAEKNPDRFEPDLATSLNNYASYLSDNGDYAASLSHAKQALELYQKLAEKNPDRFEHDLAMSLNNYANFLSDNGDYAAALSHAKQALELYQKLAEKNPDRFEPDVAMSLNNYAKYLNDQGDYPAALNHAKQALEIRQKLAEKNPDRFEPDVAMSLNNYASHLSDQGDYAAALSHAKQALDIRQKLAEKNPNRFAAEAYGSSCLGNFLSWLASSQSHNLPFAYQYFEAIPAHQQATYQLYQYFVQACYEQGQALSSTAFEQVILLNAKLNLADKNSCQDSFLCAAAWCAQYAPHVLEGQDWLSEWQRFYQQHQGQIPSWMLDLARRLDFMWPSCD